MQPAPIPSHLSRLKKRASEFANSDFKAPPYCSANLAQRSSRSFFLSALDSRPSTDFPEFACYARYVPLHPLLRVGPSFRPMFTALVTPVTPPRTPSPWSLHRALNRSLYRFPLRPPTSALFPNPQPSTLFHFQCLLHFCCTLKTLISPNNDAGCCTVALFLGCTRARSLPQPWASSLHDQVFCFSDAKSKPVIRRVKAGNAPITNRYQYRQLPLVTAKSRLLRGSLDFFPEHSHAGRDILEFPEPGTLSFRATVLLGKRCPLS